MGLIPWPFRRKLIREDADFGCIHFENGAWTSVPPDSPLPFMLVVIAGEIGPSIEQREFLKRLVRDIARFESKGLNFVNLNRRSKEHLYTYSLEIPPDVEIGFGRFTIEFADREANIVYRAEFVDFEPFYYGRDD